MRKVKKRCGLFIFAGLAVLMSLNVSATTKGSAGQRTAATQNHPQMNFVLGTDPNFLFPTLVTVHSLLKNITQNARIRVVIVLYGEAVNLQTFIIEAFKKFNDKFKGKVIELVFINGREGPFVGMATSLLSPAYRGDSNKIFIQAKTAVTLSVVPNIYNYFCPIFYLSHYMWLDSDILIKNDAAIPYTECLKSGCPFGAVNRLFVQTKGLSGWQGVAGEVGPINLLRWDKEISDIQGSLTLAEQENYGSIYCGKRRWNTSGGFCFTNLLRLAELLDKSELEISSNAIDDEIQMDCWAADIPLKIEQSGATSNKMMFALPCKYNFKTLEIETLRTLFRGINSKEIPNLDVLKSFIEKIDKDQTTNNLLKFLDVEPENLEKSLKSLGEVELMFRKNTLPNIHPDRDTKFWEVPIHKSVVEAAKSNKSVQLEDSAKLRDVVDLEWSNEFIETMEAIGYPKLTVQQATKKLMASQRQLKSPESFTSSEKPWYVIRVHLQTPNQNSETYTELDWSKENIPIFISE